MFTIQVFSYTRAIRVIYALLPDKRQSTSYTELERPLKHLEPFLNRILVLTDFEKVAINTFAETFQQNEQHGCFFHFSGRLFHYLPAIFRQIQRLGL